MKKVLFINGCVRGEQSRTLELANKYISTLREKSEIEVTERNLCEENITFLTSKNFDSQTGEMKPNSDLKLAEEFAKADEIIIAAPFWEFMFPAIVNCYLEMISVPGVTFKYTAEGSVGICKADTLAYIFTAGDNLKDEDKICEKYLARLSNLYGISQFKTFSAEGLDIKPNDAKNILEEASSKIK